MYKALDVANYVIAYYGKQGVSISNLKLQKVLYFLQANQLVSTRLRLFEDPIMAVDFGPMVEKVFMEYRVYGSAAIPYQAMPLDQWIHNISYSDTHRVNELLNELKFYSSTSLLDVIHYQSPWIDAYFKSEPSYKKIISCDSLYNYFADSGVEKDGVKMELRFSNQPIRLFRPSIFLAGPTMRNSCFKDSWRKEACDILDDLGFKGIVYIPENNEEKEYTEDQAFDQIRWEWSCLDEAGVIAFWVPRDLKCLPGFTTNVEFGRYIEKKPKAVVLGYPPEAPKMRYLAELYKEKTSRIPCSSLKETLEESLKILS